MSLIDKKVVVTGAGQGIGKGIALRLAAEGADVAVVDVKEEQALQTVAEIRKLGRQAKAYIIDLRDVQKIEPLFEQIVDDFERLDIVVNAAGVISIQPFLEVTEKNWDDVMDINAKSLFFCVQQGAKQLLKTGGGRIINISSITAKGSRPNYAVYAASKAAIISITRSAATAFVDKEIRVNAICPGYVHTEMWEKIDDYYVDNFKHPEGYAIEEMLDRIPMRRPGRVDEIAGMVVYLSSKDADYITGQSINICGGAVMY